MTDPNTPRTPGQEPAPRRVRRFSPQAVGLAALTIGLVSVAGYFGTRAYLDNQNQGTTLTTGPITPTPARNPGVTATLPGNAQPPGQLPPGQLPVAKTPSSPAGTQEGNPKQPGVVTLNGKKPTERQGTKSDKTQGQMAALPKTPPDPFLSLPGSGGDDRVQLGPDSPAVPEASTPVIPSAPTDTQVAASAALGPDAMPPVPGPVIRPTPAARSQVITLNSNPLPQTGAPQPSAPQYVAPAAPVQISPAPGRILVNQYPPSRIRIAVAPTRPTPVVRMPTRNTPIRISRGTQVIPGRPMNAQNLPVRLPPKVNPRSGPSRLPITVTPQVSPARLNPNVPTQASVSAGQRTVIYPPQGTATPVMDPRVTPQVNKPVDATPNAGPVNTPQTPVMPDAPVRTVTPETINIPGNPAPVNTSATPNTINVLSNPAPVNTPSQGDNVPKNPTQPNATTLPDGKILIAISSSPADGRVAFFQGPEGTFEAGLGDRVGSFTLVELEAGRAKLQKGGTQYTLILNNSDNP